MDFSWTEEQLAFKKRMIAFARESLSDNVVKRDLGGEFSKELWNKCADFGIQALSVPAEYGGPKQEVDILTAMLAMEGLGYGCKDNGLTFGLNAQMWTVQLPIVHFGTESQKKKYLPGFLDGSLIGAHALTEHEAGSDLFNLQMTAEKVKEGYLLNGVKRLVTFAPIADVALILANVNPDLGKWGITAFLVDRDTPGYTAGPVMSKMGLRTVPFGEISLEDCLVPESNRLGQEGTGFSLINHSLEFERCCIQASQLGAMERQLEEAVNFAKKRIQFNQPIAQFQSVSNRLVEMKLRLETSRLLLYKVAWLKKLDKPAMLEAALLKLYLSECFLESSLDSIRTFGGSGYLSDLGVERDLRDAVGGTLYAGTSDIQRNIVAKLMGL